MSPNSRALAIIYADDKVAGAHEALKKHQNGQKAT